jgi:predicted enzyme involved in methoxymalonyl-ACP biosynthesis
MSCRVLGRKVEEAMLCAAARAAREAGMKWLIGRYVPTAKNGMVKDHYAKLGFTSVEESADGASVWRLGLKDYVEPDLPMRVVATERLTAVRAAS